MMANYSGWTMKTHEGYIQSYGGDSGVVDGENGSNYTISGKSSGEQHFWSWPTTIVLSIVLSILIVLTIGGNLLVISVVIRHKGMRTRTNMFLVNLSIADFLVGLLIMPMSLITVIKGHWIFNDVICTINGFLNAMCLMGSLQLLMYISIHKYFSIARPFSRFLTVRKILIMIAAAWTWAVFCSVITVTGLQHVEYKPGTMQCGPSYPHDLPTYIHHGIIQITDMFIPLGVMIFCYTRIFIEIRQHTKRMRANSTLERDTILAQQKKVTMTLFIVLACFVCCWLPYHVYASYVSYVKDKKSIPAIINALAYTFGYMNSACNPIIYALRSPSFREGYMEILCRKDAIVMSDDTIQDDSPTSFTRRFSAFIGSMRQSIRRTRSGSEMTANMGDSRRGSCNSLNSNNKLISPREKKMSITQLMRQSPRNPKGSSIIKSDGSIIVMKNGKIVCVRQQPEKRKISASFPTWNSGKDSDETHVDKGNVDGETLIEQIPLLENGHPRAAERDSSLLDGNKLVRNADFRGDNLGPKDSKLLGTPEHCAVFDDISTSMTSEKSDAERDAYSDYSLTDDLERPGCGTLGVDKAIELSRSQPNITVAITIDSGNDSPVAYYKSDDHFNFDFPQTLPKPETRLTKSDMFLERETGGANTGSDPTLTANRHRPPDTRHRPRKHKSERGPRPGRTLRLPSVEHLDVPVTRRRSNSDSRTHNNKPKSSPKGKRRSWFGAKHRPSTAKDSNVAKMGSKDEMTHL